MAKFKNITGGRLIVMNELGLPVGFEPDEELSGLSNYLEIFTDTYRTGEDVVLRRIGDLDVNEEGQVVPVAGIEEENLVVRPSAPNDASVFYPDGDDTNEAPRLARVVFDTEDDTPRRQIDTRFLDVKPALTRLQNETLTDGGSAENTDLDISGGTTSGVINNPPVAYAGRRATASDVANSIYGSLLTEGKYYKGFGTCLVYDADIGGDTNYTIGFVIAGDGTVTQTANPAGVSVTVTLSYDVSHQEIDIVAVGAGANDYCTITFYYAQTLSTGALVNDEYDSDDEIRGWYAAENADMINGILGYPVTTLLLTDQGIHEYPDGGTIEFTAWT